MPTIERVFTPIRLHCENMPRPEWDAWRAAMLARIEETLRLQTVMLTMLSEYLPPDGSVEAQQAEFFRQVHTDLKEMDETPMPDLSDDSDLPTLADTLDQMDAHAKGAIAALRRGERPSMDPPAFMQTIHDGNQPDCVNLIATCGLASSGKYRGCWGSKTRLPYASFVTQSCSDESVQQ